MNHDQLKRRLHADADPYEAAYRGRPLPLSLDAPAPRSSVLPMATAALAGAVTALALMAVTGTSVVGPFSNANTGLGPEAAERPCRSADFSVRSEPWADAPMAGGVLVIFQATETAWCHLQHGTYTIVSDANGANSIAEIAAVFPEPIAVAPGQAWQSGVYWSTYCGNAGGTVAAPEHAARPLRLSMAIAIQGEPMDGEQIITADTLLPVATDAEIAPEPCEDDQPGTPFWLGSTGLDPYPGPAPSVSGS